MLTFSFSDASHLTQMAARYPAESKRAEKVDENRVFNCIDPPGIDVTRATTEHIQLCSWEASKTLIFFLF